MNKGGTYVYNVKGLLQYEDIGNIITNANSPVSTILKDDENTFMYTNPVNETIAYKWVNLSDPNMII